MSLYNAGMATSGNQGSNNVISIPYTQNNAQEYGDEPRSFHTAQLKDEVVSNISSANNQKNQK